MTGPVWTAADPDGDVLEVYRRVDLEPDFDLDRLPQVIGSLRMYERVFYLERDTARALWHTVGRLLGVDEQSSAPDPASLYIGRRPVAIGLQLDEHVQALARVTQRAYELDGAVMPVSLKVAKLTEVVHLLAVQEQRVAASLGDLLSELAGGQS